MELAHQYFVIILIISLIVEFLLMGKVWRHRKRPVASIFLVLTLAVSVWSIAAIGAHVAQQLETKIFWTKVSYLGVITLPVAWLIFSLSFIGKTRWLTKRNIILVCTAPIISLIMVWTNNLHHMMWRDFWLNTTVDPPIIIITHGSWFWFHATYSYVLLLLGSICLLSWLLKRNGIYRKQVGIMLLAVFAPWIADFLYLAKIYPFGDINFTPVSFVITGLAFYWGMSRLYLLDIMPIAKDAIFRSMKDGVVVTDTQNTIIDINKAAMMILDVNRDVIGGQYNRVIPGQVGAIELKAEVSESHTAISLDKGPDRYYYGVHISPITIEQRFSGHVVILHDDTQAISLATTDGLTGLYNHRQFHRLLEQEIGRSARYANVFSLLMLDVDLFKTFNDTYGHLAGDNVLHEIGECITKSIRSIDYAFRYGGEEFAIILPGTSLEDAFAAAERIRNNIEQVKYLPNVSVTASLGVACWPSDGVAKEEIIARADAALYLAKHMGRNRTCLSTDLAESATPAELKKQTQNLSTVYALAAAVEAKDPYTYGHSQKVTRYSVAIAQQLGLSEQQVATLRAAALLHDIGKIGIPDTILGKEGSINEQEWAVIKTHPERGVKIVQQIADLNACLPAIMHHHERYDGSGYPSRLSGEKIPLEARILAIADAYDAMISPRSYHVAPYTKQEAIEEMKRCAGTQFDPALVDVFCRVLEQFPQTDNVAKTQG